MHKVAFAASCFAIICLIGTAPAALPARKPELVDAVIDKVVPATDAEKKEGVVVTVFLKDRKDGVTVTKETALHQQMGKLVPAVEVGDLKAGAKVSVWLDGKSGIAEGVLIFPGGAPE